jgi:D-beta-D-heptose 7-phosphate kinase/D-beta-D-heptose 1-phosphate adenosyltransferase
MAQDVYDVTGAGDTVIATMALALASGADLKEAAVMSNHAAGVVVGKLGTAAITTLELTEAIEKSYD